MLSWCSCLNEATTPFRGMASVPVRLDVLGLEEEAYLLDMGSGRKCNVCMFNEGIDEPGL